MTRLFYSTWIISALLTINFSGYHSFARTNHVKQQVETTSEGKLFYDYEVIEHYHNPNPDITIFASKFEHDFYKRKRAVVYFNTPINLSDTAFIEELRSFGFRRSYVHPRHFKTLNQVFVERNIESNTITRCNNIFRDVLIFRKDNAIVGIAKLCFGCGGSYFVGTDANTSQFGKSKEYEILLQILREKWPKVEKKVKKKRRK